MRWALAILLLAALNVLASGQSAPTPASSTLAYCTDNAALVQLVPALNALYDEQRYYQARADDNDFVDRHLEGDVAYVAARAAAFDRVTSFVHERLEDCVTTQGRGE